MTTYRSKLTSKGQVTLPSEVRASLQVGPGDHVEFFLHRTGEVFVHARNRPASAIFGKGRAYGRSVSREDSERLVAEAVAARGAPAVSRRPRARRRKSG